MWSTMIHLFWSNRCRRDVLAIIPKLENVKYSHYMLTWMTNAGSKRIEKEKDVRNGGFSGSGGTKSTLRISPINFKRPSCCVTSVSCSSWWLCSLKRCVESAAHLTQHGRQTEFWKKLVKLNNWQPKKFSWADADQKRLKSGESVGLTSSTQEELQAAEPVWQEWPMSRCSWPFFFPFPINQSLLFF